ncbi:MAG: hypothetical protein QM622_09810 [Microbacterium sp.]
MAELRIDRDGRRYLRVAGIPTIDACGVTITARLQPRGAPTGIPRVAVAHAQHAAGWWIGVNARGRISVGVATREGPVALPAGDPLREGESAIVTAVVPGRPGERLEVSVDTGGATPTRADVVLGSPVLPARTPLTWGGRFLDRDSLELPFGGAVADVVIVGGTGTTPVECAKMLARWEGSIDLG